MASMASKRVLPLVEPALVSLVQPLYHGMLAFIVRYVDHTRAITGNSLGGLLQHVVSMPARNWDEGNSFGVVTNLLDKVGGFLDNFMETVLAPLCIE